VDDRLVERQRLSRSERSEAVELRAGFQRVHYCFSD
jgi:hypothetical protein